MPSQKQSINKEWIHYWQEAAGRRPPPEVAEREAAAVYLSQGAF